MSGRCWFGIVYVADVLEKSVCVCVCVAADCVSGRSAAGGGSLGVKTSSWGGFRSG